MSLDIPRGFRSRDFGKFLNVGVRYNSGWIRRVRKYRWLRNGWRDKLGLGNERSPCWRMLDAALFEISSLEKEDALVVVIFRGLVFPAREVFERQSFDDLKNDDPPCVHLVERINCSVERSELLSYLVNK